MNDSSTGFPGRAVNERVIYCGCRNHHYYRFLSLWSKDEPNQWQQVCSKWTMAVSIKRLNLALNHDTSSK